MAAKAENAVQLVDTDHVASLIRNRIEKVLVIDSRSFLEFNNCHINGAVNVCCSKLVKRRLQQNKLSVKDFLMHTCHIEVDESNSVIVYDHGSPDFTSLPADSFLYILLMKLIRVFLDVRLLSGGFLEFQAAYSELCEDKSKKFPTLTSLSQPCLPVSNIGPTRILPFLYLGSQQDAINKDLLQDHSITYELNVSTNCPQPNFIKEGHFMRIPVNDSYNEKLLPHFVKAFQFLDKVRQSSGCVLVHCLAGISRSPTVAIAYVMRHLKMSGEDAYRYVKSKRATISPNFNFLGQLLEYEKQLRAENVLENKEPSSVSNLASVKRQCKSDGWSRIPCSVNLHLKHMLDPVPSSPEQSPGETEHSENRTGIADLSPTTAFSRLNFESCFGQEEKISDNYFVSGNEKTLGSHSCVSVITKRTYSELNSSEHSNSLSTNLGHKRTTENTSEITSISVAKTFVGQASVSVRHQTSEVTLSSEIQSSAKIPVASVCVSSPVRDNLTDIFDSEPSIREMKAPIRGIPVSSLSDISFTPCQTSESSSVNNSHDPSPEPTVREVNAANREDVSGFLDCASGKTSVDKIEECPSPQVLLSRCHSSGERVEADSCILEQLRQTRCNSDNFIIQKCNSSDEIVRHYPSSTWYVPSPLPKDFVGPCEYCRSDSISTSGLGSEISDSDAFMDLQSSCDGFAPDDSSVLDDGVFTDMHLLSPRVPKQTLRPSSLTGASGVTHAHVDQQSGKADYTSVLVRERNPEDTYGRSGKKDSGYYSVTEPSLNISETHRGQGSSLDHCTDPERDTCSFPAFWQSREDVEQIGKRSLNVDIRLCDKTSSQRLIDGTHSADNRKGSECCDSCDVDQGCEKRQSYDGDSTLHWNLGQESIYETRTGATELKASQELTDSLSFFEKQAAKKFADLQKEIVGLKECIITKRGSKDGKGKINLLTADNTRKICINLESGKREHHLPAWASMKPQEYKGRDDGLYRVQSCPGIVGIVQQTPLFESLDTAAALVSDLEPAVLRGSKSKKHGKADRVRNRYSCGSLDHSDYEKLNFDYCPELFLSCSCQNETDSQHSSSSSMSHTCGPFVGNHSIIQVS